jgi:hypothetical protein
MRSKNESLLDTFVGNLENESYPYVAYKERFRIIIHEWRDS